MPPSAHSKAIRPWQHVLEPLHGHILLAQKLLSPEREQAARYATTFNFGSSDHDTQTVGWIVEKIVEYWGDCATWMLDAEPGVHEPGYLKLDASRARAELGWYPRLHLEASLEWLIH